MDKILLKRMAMKSIALMCAVITYSFALKQYHTVAIAKVSQSGVGKYGSMVSPPWEDSLTSLSCKQTGVPVVELTEVQRLESGVEPEVLQKLGDSYIVIKKPQGKELNIGLDDLYMKKSIQLKITGIASDIMSSADVVRVKEDVVYSGEPVYKEIISTKIDEETGEEEVVITKEYGKDPCHTVNITEELDAKSNQYAASILIELDSVYAPIIYEDLNNYYLDLKKPSEVYDKILVIDAGHGGKDAGALSKDSQHYEKNINLAIVMELKELLDKENIKVYYTRTSDETVYLRPRAELANGVDCDYFISIHCNANEVTSPNGMEVLYFKNEFKGIKSHDLAKVFAEELGDAISLKNRGIVKKNAEDIFIMNKATVPMVLIEVGYLTNHKDMNYLSKPENRKKAAQGIYNGIMRAYEEIPAHKGQGKDA